MRTALLALAFALPAAVLADDPEPEGAKAEAREIPVKGLEGGHGRFSGPIKIANRRGLEKHVESWQRLDIVDLKQFASESFDAVACLGSVLCCVLDRASEAVAELRRVTRPGGRLALRFR